MSKEIDNFKNKLIDELISEARRLYCFKDEEKRNKVSGIALAIQIIKDFKG